LLFFLLHIPAAVSDRPVWWHYLSITVPDVIKYPNAVLFIDGGSNNDEYDDCLFSLLFEMLGVVVVGM
jgi:hypothetical protein